MTKIKAKAPTKIILIGEHGVVYGRPALVCAIDLYCYASVFYCEGDKILFRDKKDGKKKEYIKEYKIGEILDLKENFKDKKDRLFKITLNEVLKYLKIENVKPFEVIIEKEAPIGGCGVSTSVIVSVSRALAKYFAKKVSEKDLFEIAMRVETRFHGYKSSGLDQAAIVYRGLIRYQKKEKGFDYKKLNIRSDILKNFLIINSGSPEVLTGEVVEFVRREKGKDPNRVDKVFDNLESLTDDLVNALENDDKEKFYNIVDRAGEELINLGIVTPNTQKIITNIKKIGGHLKISGAGAHKGEGSGALVCFSDDRERIEDYLRGNNLDFYRVDVAG